MSEAALRSALAGRYTLEREIGRGGMATVWLAHDLRHDRPVAVKMLHPHLAAPVGKTRFLREIRLAARLEHPHVLPVFDSGTAGDLFWYVTPFLGQGSLRDLLRGSGPLPVDQALRLGREMAGALAFAHSFGIVHRDVKPENVLLADGQALLADFGIAYLADPSGARLTDTGLSLGTPAYMSPEQAGGERQIDGRADVYALGAVLYEMLSGLPPYTGPSARAILALQMNESPRPLRAMRSDVSEEVEAAVFRALARNPSDRFETAAAFASAIDELRYPQPATPTPKRARGSVMLLAAVGAVTLAAVLLGRRRDAAAPVDERLMAILPFASSVRDTALERLGRDLVFTLSATLDGVGELRTVNPHTILALVPMDTAQTLEQGARLARRFGAGRVLEGSLVRDGSLVRASISLHDTEALTTRAQVTVRAAPDSIARLTDSLGLGLLREALPASTLPTGGLAAALRTRSVPALRAFLEGEQHLAASRLPESIEAFRRAFAVDSSFWLAAARLQYAMSWWLLPEDSTLSRSLSAHREQLPERERMDLDAATVGVDSEGTPALRLLRRAVQHDPTSWFRWLAYGDAMFHRGPLQGIPALEAKTAIDRALLLNPRFVPAADHAMLMALLFRDSAGITQGLAIFDGPGASVVTEYGNLRMRYHLLAALVRGDSSRAALMADSVVLDKVVPGRNPSSFFEPMHFGMPAWQVKLEQGVLLHRLDAVQTNQHRVFLAQGWASSGAWDSALAVRSLPVEDVYRLAVLGMTLGALPPERAAQIGSAVRDGPLSGAPDWRSELIWLDGVVAAKQGDAAGLRQALASLSKDTSVAGRTVLPLLRRIEAARLGHLAVAAESLAAIDSRLTETGYAATTGMASVLPLVRVQLAHWLDSLGHAAWADSTRRWIESPFFVHGSIDYNSAIAPYVWLERARAADKRGDAELAERAYTWFVRAVDQPDASLQAARDEAVAALARLGAAP